MSFHLKFAQTLKSRSSENSPNTSLIGISDSSSRTLARAGVALVNWNGSWSARVRRARVWSWNALLLTTNVPVLAIGVDHTLRSTTCDRVRLGNEAGQAPTNRVATCVGAARCSAGEDNTAGVGVARIRFGTLDQRMRFWSVSLQSIPALAHGQPLLGDAHGCRVARTWDTRVPWWLWWRLVLWLRWWCVPKTSVRTAVEAAKSPVGAIEVRDSDGPAGREPACARAV